MSEFKPGQVVEHKETKKKVEVYCILGLTFVDSYGMIYSVSDYKTTIPEEETNYGN